MEQRCKYKLFPYFCYMAIRIEKAVQRDAPRIFALAEKIWHHHYPDIITTEQIHYMLQTMYNTPSLVHQMEAEHQVFYFIYSDLQCIGFFSISTQDQEVYWLHKFYILPEAQGKGIGTEIFSHMFAVMQQAKVVRLTVNRKNYKSINFYFKNGFVIERIEDFDIGNGYYMNDFIMIKKFLHA